MLKLDDSPMIFREIAQKFGPDPITERRKLSEFFEELHARTEGLVILDFLDLANWDRIEAFEMDEKTGILTLTWHDYRSASEDPDEMEMRQMVFPAALYACALQVNSVVPIIGKRVALFFVNAYSKTEKEIRNLYKQGADEIKVMDSSFFEKRVVRKAAGNFEIIDFHCTPIFSLAIVPKRSGIGSHDSKEMLYSHNFRVGLERLNRVVASLDSLPAERHDEIAEKVNTVRRIMEFVLKVECCSRELDLSKNYSQVLLGDLIARVKPLKEPAMQAVLGRLAEMANEFSHDSGKPIDHSKAKVVALLALAYTSLVELEHRHGAG